MNPFSLSETNNGLSKLSALSKLISLTLLSMTSMNAQLPELIALLVASLIFHFIYRIKLADSKKMLLFILYITIFTSIVGIIAPGDGRLFSIELLPRFLTYSLRLYTVFFFSHLFYATTKVSDLGNYMTRLAQKARKDRFKSELINNKYSDSIDPGMAISLTLLFLPRSFSIYETIREAAEIRGYGLKKHKIADFLKILETFLIFSLRYALKTSNAMKIRGYSPWRTVRVQKLKLGDYFLVIGSLILVFPILCKI